MLSTGTTKKIIPCKCGIDVCAHHHKGYVYSPTVRNLVASCYRMLLQSSNAYCVCLQVVKWLPQNDVLGSPQTRAFMSHCGANSLYEAAFHGVPIIALPFFADQPGNADKAVAKVGQTAGCFSACAWHVLLPLSRYPAVLMWLSFACRALQFASATLIF